MNIEQAIVDEVEKVLKVAREKFPSYDAPAPEIKFYTKGRAAGKATSGILVSFNTAIFAQDPERFIRETVPHEIAHIVCFYLRIDRGHGKAWKRVCLALGGNGERLYKAECANGEKIKFDGISRTTKRYQHIATCGRQIMLTSVRHNRIMRGATYTVLETGGELNKQTFVGNSGQ
jgi:SprT protein